MIFRPLVNGTMLFRFCYGKLPQAMWHPMEWLSIMLFVVYISSTYSTRLTYILHLDSFIKNTLVFNTELEKWHLSGLRHENEDPCILLNFAQPRNHYGIQWNCRIWWTINVYDWSQSPLNHSFKNTGNDIRRTYNQNLENTLLLL